MVLRSCPTFSEIFAARVIPVTKATRRTPTLRTLAASQTNFGGFRYRHHLVGLLFRCVGTYISLIGTPFNLKERIFYVIAYTPIKAALRKER